MTNVSWACIVQRAVGAVSTDIPCAGSALAVLACRISVIYLHQPLLMATTEDRCMTDTQLYSFYHRVLIISVCLTGIHQTNELVFCSSL